MEEWRPIVGWEGWYSVSSVGRIRRDRSTDVAPGSRFGRLIVLGPGQVDVKASGKRAGTYRCRCDCGQERIVNATNLRRGLSRSCPMCARTSGAVPTDSIVILPVVLSPSVDRCGYVMATMSRPGQRAVTRVFIHRLVMAAFVGPRPEGCEVNHRNGRRDDNRVENLEYVTARQNVRHAYEVLGRGGATPGSRNVGSKLTEAAVIAIRTEAAGHLSAGKRLPSGVGAALAQRFGVTTSTISRILHRSGWRHAR